ncbi:hypothetical protein FACS189413_00240 [Bacteroidia bacterium]|nr:hypothetical protein FACS189413_00240 [Bacteroidia bacterium]
MLVVFTACGGSDDSKADQSIFFGTLAPHNLSEGSFDLTATASSGLPVSFKSSDLSVALVSGKSVILLKKGTTTITAAQSGNDAFYEAPSVNQTLIVNEDNNTAKTNQTITWDLPETAWNFSQGELTLNATATSGLPVTFSAAHPNVQISGNTLTLTYSGSHYDTNIDITAYQAGNNEYNAAPLVVKVLHISHSE